MFAEIEYVDPADSQCTECGCSFGIHLMTCSHKGGKEMAPKPVSGPKVVRIKGGLQIQFCDGRIGFVSLRHAEKLGYDLIKLSV